MAATIFPFKTPAGDCGVLDLFRKGTVSLFLAQIVRIDLGFAGNVRCRLKLSIGEVTVCGNRETVPLLLNEGDWVRVRVMRRYGEEEADSLRVMRMIPTMPECGAAWLPTSLCHRTAHLQRLRQLLVQLEPAMQAVFMAAMADAQVQRRFFWRVAASDHHGYPGGLFDQAVEAAEFAFGEPTDDETERGIAAMAALLFDIGKVFDETLEGDGKRLRQVLAPHRLTAFRLRRAYETVERLHPRALARLRAVLEANPGSAIGGPPEVGRLAQRVRRCVERSFDLRRHP
jgi:hypothetical protein